MPSKLPSIEMPPPEPEPTAAAPPTVGAIDNILEELGRDRDWETNRR